MKRDLAVKRGLGLEHGQEHFGKTTERVRTAVWPTSVQVGGQRVSMEAGSIGARHRPRYRPLSCLTAFRTPFLAKCQVLRLPVHTAPELARAAARLLTPELLAGRGVRLAGITAAGLVPVGQPPTQPLLLGAPDSVR